MKYFHAVLGIALVFIMGTASNTAFATERTDIATQPQQAACEVDDTISPVRYELGVTLFWNTKVVEVEQVVRYRNTHDIPLQEIVFHSEPHRLSQVNTMTFNYAQDEAGKRLSDVTIDAMRITVPLDTPVDVGCDAVVTLRYAINTQALSDSNPLGWLAYTENQLNLGHWFPTVGVFGFEVENEWYTPRRHYIGEQAFTPIADYVLNLAIVDAPTGLQLAAPGTVEQLGSATWRIRHNQARELAVSLSTQFSLRTETVDGVSVEWYTFSNPSSEALDRAMTDAVQSIELFSELFGPYPHDRLVIVEGDFPDGYEFSGLVFVSTRWFEIWNGRADHWLSVITIHEIAHQWWYVMVGSNQAETPYLDESLATLSELFYYERYAPDLVPSWFDFRLYRYDILGNVDSMVYDYTQWRPYINAVYLNGVEMFQAIRGEIGDEAFFTWLADYWSANANNIASPADLWSALPTNLYEQIAPIRTQFLANSDPLG